MARNQGTPTEDPFYRRGEANRNSCADDALPLDAGLSEDDGEDEQQQFRRANKRIPVRRGALPRKAASRLRTAAVVALVLAVLGAGIYEVQAFALHSTRFRVRNEKDIELAGEAPNSRAQAMEKMRETVGRNVFQISLAERKQELEKIPWVESASVSRLWPNHLRVMVKERTPVAFIALGGRIALIDAQGVVMELPPGVPNNYSFPVILGMSESDPLSTRAPRMQTFTRLMRELDGDDGGSQAKAQYSRDLEEVDLSDPGDVKVTAKGGSGPILLHLGNESFLPRFMVFLSNVQKWEQDRGKLESVDLRYGREVILNPDLSAAAPPPPPMPAAKPAPQQPAAHAKSAPPKKATSNSKPNKGAKDQHPKGKKHK
jgi:cell division protein FtsQ